MAATISDYLARWNDFYVPYSMSGALLSYFGMLLVKQLGPKRVSIIGISAAGGFMHNVGQLLMASSLRNHVQSCCTCQSFPFWESCQESLSGSRRIIFTTMCRHCNDSKKIYEQGTKQQWSPMFTKNNRHTRSFYEATSNVGKLSCFK